MDKNKTTQEWFKTFREERALKEKAWTETVVRQQMDDMYLEMIERYMDGKKINVRLPVADLLGRKYILDEFNKKMTKEMPDFEVITYEQIFK